VSDKLRPSVHHALRVLCCSLLGHKGYARFTSIPAGYQCSVSSNCARCGYLIEIVYPPITIEVGRLPGEEKP